MNTLFSTACVLAAAEMAPRLFDLDVQLLADAALSILAVSTLFLVMSYSLFNPARAFLDKRREGIREKLEEAKTAREEALLLKADYEARLKGIQAEAEGILTEARKKALANEHRMLAQAKKEAESIIERAKKDALLEKQKMADEIKKEIVSVAALMADRVIGSAVDVSVQGSLIDRTLKEIGEDTWLS